MLLLANRQLSPQETDDDDDNDKTTPFSYTLINDLLIIVMMTQLFCDPAADNDNANTTF